MIRKLIRVVGGGSCDPEAPAHRCKQGRILVLCGTLLMIALGWLFQTVYAGELDRAVVKTKLEAMAEDVKAIRAALEVAMKDRRAP